MASRGGGGEPTSGAGPGTRPRVPAGSVTIVDRTGGPPVDGSNGSAPDGAEAAVVLGDRLRHWIDAGCEVTILVRPAGLDTTSETQLTAAAMTPDGTVHAFDAPRRCSCSPVSSPPAGTTTSRRSWPPPIGAGSTSWG